MKILVLNGTYQAEGTTAELARSFMDGAKSAGADVDMIMLRDKKLQYCANCLKCYSFAGDGIAPCALRDDMDEIIARIVEADGVLFASPVHNGFVTGLMTVFWERLSWRVARMGPPILGMNRLESRIDNKVRALGSIASAGGMPERFRKFCDDGTPWLKSNSTLLLHGQWIGDVYAGAELERMPESAEDWRRIYFLRRLSAGQRQRARELGVKMAGAIKSGNLTPCTMERLVPPPLRWIMEGVCAIGPPYRVARQ